MTAARIKPEGDNHGGFQIACAEWRCTKRGKFYEPAVSAYASDSGRVKVTGAQDLIDWIYNDDMDNRYELRQSVTLPGLRDNAVAHQNAQWGWYCGIHARMAKIVKRSEERRASDARITENIAEERRQREMELSDAERAVVNAATGLYADPSTATFHDLRAAVEALEVARYQPDSNE